MFDDDDGLIERMEDANIIQLIFHVVLCTRNRRPLISAAFRDDLYEYLSIGRHEFGQVHCIGGADNHIHVLLSMSPVNSVDRTIRKLKRISARWINEKLYPSSVFRWHGGYLVFGVSGDLCKKEMCFIQRQPRLHEKVTLEKEYTCLLDRNGIQYDPDNLWG